MYLFHFHIERKTCKLLTILLQSKTLYLVRDKTLFLFKYLIFCNEKGCDNFKTALKFNTVANQYDA